MNKLVLLSLTAGLMASACTDAADDGDYLFGLNADEVLELRDAYHPGAADDAALAQLQAPFDCANYGDLCRLYGEDLAYELVEREVEMGLAGASAEEIDVMIDARTESVDPAGSSRAWSVQTTVRALGPARRVKITYGTLYPLLGSAHSKCVVRYQHLAAGVWGNQPADMLRCRTVSEVLWWQTVLGGWTSGVTNGATDVNTLFNAASVTARANHNRPNIGWSPLAAAPFPGSGAQIVQKRVKVTVLPLGWTSTRTWQLI